MKNKDGSGIAIGLISGLAAAGILAKQVRGSASTARMPWGTEHGDYEDRVSDTQRNKKYLYNLAGSQPTTEVHIHSRRADGRLIHGVIARTTMDIAAHRGAQSVLALGLGHGSPTPAAIFIQDMRDPKRHYLVRKDAMLLEPLEVKISHKAMDFPDFTTQYAAEDEAFRRAISGPASPRAQVLRQILASVPEDSDEHAFAQLCLDALESLPMARSQEMNPASNAAASYSTENTHVQRRLRDQVTANHRFYLEFQDRYPKREPMSHAPWSRGDQPSDIRGSRLIMLPPGLTIVEDWQTPRDGQVRRGDVADANSAWYAYVNPRKEALSRGGRMSWSEIYRKASNEFYSK